MRRFLPGFVKRGLKAVGLRAVDKLREWTRPNNNSLVSGAVADATRSKSELMLENALLRQQVIVLDRQVKRPVLSWRERGIMVLLASQLRHCLDHCTTRYAAQVASRSVPVGVAAQITTEAARWATPIARARGATHPALGAREPAVGS
jgi:hypothetical protein